MPWMLGTHCITLRPSPPALTIALLALVLSIPLPRAEARPDGPTWQVLLAGFQARGITVVTSHPHCRQPGLEALYTRGRIEVVVCLRGEPSTTLRHEGWHLVQHLCLEGRPGLHRGRWRQA